MDKEENATGDGDHKEASGYAQAVGPEEDMEEDVEDDEEDEEDEEVEEDNGNDEENVLSFIDGINPLNFVEDDGDQLYQRLLGTDYEALAGRKRKALVDSRPGSTKKARQEDLTGASMEEIMEAMNYGMQRRSRKSKKRGRRKGSMKKLTPEINRMLGEANLHYAFGRFEEAVPILSEVVKKAPD